jgi:cardiolipin synthase
MPAWAVVTLTVAGFLFVSWFFLVLLFTPAVHYRVRQAVDLKSAEFLHLAQATCQTVVHRGNHVTIFRNGDQFYPAMLEAVRSATTSINLECYIFASGTQATLFIEALSARARAGVLVSVVVDAVGTPGWKAANFDALREAGGRVEYYQSLHWYSLHRLNNRTHRELLIVDGSVGFIGGAGIADQWAQPQSGLQWRDSMARVEGPVVATLQGVFAENWLECCGEILTGAEYFPPLREIGDTTAFVIKSSPADRATISRITFQLLIESASQRIYINTPYLLPDRMLRKALVDAAARGVDIRAVVPGRHMDQRWVRIASRRLYGDLLEAGVKVYEYGRGMMHAKMLMVDDLWSIMGSTNFDNRSFEHNDEVNIAMRDSAIAQRMVEEFVRDSEDSTLITLASWRARPLWERIVGSVAWLLERQQ